MKKPSVSLCLCAIGLFLAFSCKKSNSGNNSPVAASSYVSSVVFYASLQKTVDSFYYDSTHLLDTFTQTTYDTSGTNYFYDSYTVRFIYQSPNTFPSYYYMYDVTKGNYGDYHLLSYDGQGRISKDTSLSGSGYVTYYSYPNNNIAAIDLPEGNVQDNTMDTFYITNENVSSYAIYASVIPNQPDIQQIYAQNIYTSVANPVYHTAITSTIGPLLNNIEYTNGVAFMDFLSKNAIDQVSGLNDNSSLPDFSFGYTQTLDNKGRLSKLTESPGSNAGNYVFSYY